LDLREEITGGWKKIPTEGLHKMYSLLNIRTTTTSEIRWGECNTHGVDEKFIQSFGRKTYRDRTRLK
jgi:hypothetical protein